MRDQTPEATRQWLDFVAGRSKGTIAVLLALVATHPNPEALLAEIEKVEQSALAHAEASPFPDVYLEGLRDVIDTIRNMLVLRATAASDRNKP